MRNKIIIYKDLLLNIDKEFFNKTNIYIKVLSSLNKTI